MKALGTAESTDAVDELGLRIPVGELELEADLCTPRNPHGLILFAHGGGSSRFSPRNRYVAGELNRAGLATLLMDLLSPLEESADRVSGHLRFDIGLLAARLAHATEWIRKSGLSLNLDLGYFGASTGGGAALRAAARFPDSVRAVVVRGGRPDLAGASLPHVEAPTLFIVGSRDTTVLALNRTAMSRMSAPTRIEVVPGATHLFEEPGALEQVARFAREWFDRYCGHAQTSRSD